MLSQPTLNTAPLFQTSLRDWQARWKESQGQSAGPVAEPNRTRPGRVGRRSRRPAARAQA